MRELDKCITVVSGTFKTWNEEIIDVDYRII